MWQDYSSTFRSITLGKFHLYITSIFLTVEGKQWKNLALQSLSSSDGDNCCCSYCGFWKGIKTFFFHSQIPESPLSVSYRHLCMLTPKELLHVLWVSHFCRFIWCMQCFTSSQEKHFLGTATARLKWRLQRQQAVQTGKHMGKGT